MRRHAPEILGATLLSALFSFFSTAFAAKALALNSGADGDDEGERQVAVMGWGLA